MVPALHGRPQEVRVGRADHGAPEGIPVRDGRQIELWPLCVANDSPLTSVKLCPFD